MRDLFQAYVFQRVSELGITRSELARRAKLSRESLYKLLRGEVASPTIATLHGLSLALEVSPVFLLRKFFYDLNLGPATQLPVQYVDDHAAFVRDVTIPDDDAVGVNQTFTKTWELQNTGKQPWIGRSLICQDDEFVLARRMPDGSLQEVMNSHLTPAQRAAPIADTLPGQTVQISMDFIAPAFPCTVMSLWKVVDQEGRLCFPDFTGIWVRVRVVAL